MSEPEIIKGCQRYDRRAQRALYDRYADELMAISRRYTGDASQAQDNLHDALIKIYQNISQYKAKRGALMGWMSRIVINEALQKHRRNKWILFDSEQIKDEGGANLQLDALDKMAVEDILQLLEQLPEGCRIVFNMSVVEGLKHKEIARMLDIRASASRAQLSKAKVRLKQLINEQKKRELKTANRKL